VRIFFAPFQRLRDDLVLVRASDLLQKSLASLVVNKHSERTGFRISPSVQLDRKMAVINGQSQMMADFSGLEADRKEGMPKKVHAISER
jgi:hypothetical protein